MASIAFVLWRCLARYPLGTEEHKIARLNYVNFAAGLSFSFVAFACVIYEFGQQQPWLLKFSFIAWTCTVIYTIWQSQFHRALKITAYSIVLIAPLLFFFNFRGQPHGGISGFLEKLDTFVVIGRREQRTPKRNSSAEQPDTSSPTAAPANAPLTSSTKASPTSSPNASESSETDGGLRPSVFLEWLFYFVSAFAFLHYYGRMYEASYRDRLRRQEIERGLQEGAVSRSAVVLSLAFSFFLALVFVGTQVDKLGIFSGLLAAGVSIALRDLLANMAAGMLLLWEKSIKKGDVISLDDNRYGRVKNMTMRYLVLQDRNEVQFFIPNSEFINKTIVNWTHGNESKVRLKLDFGVAYGSEIEKIKEILGAICLRVGRVLREPSPRVLVLGFGESSINLQLRFFISDPEAGIRNVLSEIYEHLIIEFNAAEIVVPFPQREIRILNAESENEATSSFAGRLILPGFKQRALPFLFALKKS